MDIISIQPAAAGWEYFFEAWERAATNSSRPCWGKTTVDRSACGQNEGRRLVIVRREIQFNNSPVKDKEII